MTHIATILVSYKAFSYVFLLMTVLLLSRIPMGTFNTPSHLDTIGHFVLVATGAPLMMALLTAYKTLPALSSTTHYIFVTSLLGISLEVIWEIFEFTIDALFGLSWQLSNTDTMIDILLGVVGAVAGAMVFVRLYGVKAS